MVWTSTEPALPIPEKGGLTAFLREKFSKWGNRLALVDGATGKGYTFTELDDIVKTVAGNLYHKAGVRKGDVVLLHIPNSTYYGILALAVPSIGAILTACSTDHAPGELLREAQASNPTVLVTISEKQEIVPGLLAEVPKMTNVFIIGSNVNPTYIPIDDLFAPGQPPPDVPINNRDDLALFPYTSGTTGPPKGIMTSHHNVIAQVLSIGPEGATLYDEGTEVMVVAYPLCHVAGTVCTFYLSLLYGMTQIYYPKFEFEEFLGAVEKYKATVLGLALSAIVQLAKDPVLEKYNLSSLQKMFVGGTPVSPGILKEIQTRIPSITFISQAYGFSEANGATHSTRRGDEKLGSAGTVVPNVQCKIVDMSTGEELSPGQRGEICIRGDIVMKGYLNNPEATAERIKDGWLHTGDFGYTDESGHIFIVDRLVQLIKSEGYQVSPAELEALLLTHPDIADAAVTGVSDGEDGQVPRAFLVRKPGCDTTEQAILGFVKSQEEARLQLKGGIVFVSDIPRTTTGKIHRSSLPDPVEPTD